MDNIDTTQLILFRLQTSNLQQTVENSIRATVSALYHQEKTPHT